MKNPATLFRDLMRTAPFQPATNLWRAVELDAVQRHGLPGGRGLDLGCGDGKLTRIVDEVPARGGGARRWVGVDIDPLETSQAVAGGLYERVHTGSAAAIPEPDASVDFVFSNSVLEHIGPIDEVLAEAARLLRPGGRLITLTNSVLAVLAMPDLEEDGPATDRLLRPQRAIGRMEWPDGDRSVEFHPSHGDWIRLLRASGFEIEDFIEIYAPEGSTTEYPWMSAEWASRWPVEDAWKARKQG